MSTSYREIEFPDPGWNKLIIAMMGLPYTGKSEIAKLLGQWARCHVFYIDHFLDAVSAEKGYTAESPPSREEAERLNRLAFDVLCKAAKQQIRFRPCCVVIKSRLCSTIELDRLIELVIGCNCSNLVIIECQMKNEYRWKSRLESKLEWLHHDEWYKPRSSMDLEVARDDYVNVVGQANWDFHLGPLFNAKSEHFIPRVKRLTLDPFDDLNLYPGTNLGYLIPSFKDAIRYLIMRYYKECRYEVLQFDELRQLLLEKELRASTSRERSKYFCTRTSAKFGCCVFKYSEKLTKSGDEGHYYCGVCEDPVVSDQPAYTCHFCVLTLHKSCAENSNSDFLKRVQNYSYIIGFNYSYQLSKLQEKHACKSCVEGGRDFSTRCESCPYQMHLKRKLLPTIINHDCHHHFLSLLFNPGRNICKTCGGDSLSDGYVCNICKVYFDIQCIFRPREVKHKHGGYEHVMKLTYSRDGMEQEEDYWCDFCYRSMDPQVWFYSCQECTYYVTHLRCVGDDKRVREAAGIA